jgi:DNA-binding MarR family transcriptional regulator
MPTRRPDQLARLERALDHVAFNLHDPRLHDWDEREAGVRIGRNLHPTFVMIADYGPMRTTDLSDRLGLETSTVSRYVSALVEEGLVERAGDPADGRVRMVRVTKGGKEVLGKLWKLYRDLLDDALAGFDVEEREMFVRLLDRFSGGLERGLVARGIAVPQRRN